MSHNSKSAWGKTGKNSKFKINCKVKCTYLKGQIYKENHTFFFSDLDQTNSIKDNKLKLEILRVLRKG